MRERDPRNGMKELLAVLNTMTQAAVLPRMFDTPSMALCFYLMAGAKQQHRH